MTAGDHVIVVFGAAVTHDGRPRAALVRRLREALAASTEDPRARVLVSGGPVGGRAVEALAMRAWLVAAGLAEERILVEPRAMTTLDNAALAVELLAGLPVGKLTLVTERYHMSRSRALLARALARSGRDGIVVVPRPADDVLDPPRRAARGLWELLKLGRDAWSGGLRRSPRAPGRAR